MVSGQQAAEENAERESLKLLNHCTLLFSCCFNVIKEEGSGYDFD